MIKKKLVILILAIFTLYRFFLYSVNNQNSPNTAKETTYSEKELQNLIKEHYREIDEIHKMYHQKELDAAKRYDETNIQNLKLEKIAGKAQNYISDFIHSKQGEKFIQTLIQNPSNIDNFEPYQKFKAITLLKGSGDKAKCGDIVEFQYFISSDKTPVITKEQKSTRNVIMIGESTSPMDLQHAIIGMQPGEILSFPKKNKNSSDKEYFIIKLLKITTNKDFSSNIEILNKKYGNRKNFFKCGDKAEIFAEVKDLKGNIIFNSSKAIPIRLGSKNTDYFLTLGLESMATQNAERVLLVPGKFIKNFNINNLIPSNLYIVTIKSTHQN